MALFGFLTLGLILRVLSVPLPETGVAAFIARDRTPDPLEERTHSKPVRNQLVSIDACGSATTLDDLFEKSTLVVDGIVTGERPADDVRGGFDPRLPPVVVVTSTLYDIAIREAFKKPASIWERTRMRLPGGRRDRGAFIDDEFDARFPTPRLAEEYVLFLWVDPAAKVNIPTEHLGDSVFLIQDGTVVPRGAGPLDRAYQGRPVGDLLNALRQRAPPGAPRDEAPFPGPCSAR